MRNQKTKSAKTCAPISDALYHLLQYVAAREPGGVDLWPAGLGLSGPTRTRALKLGFTREVVPAGGMVFVRTHLTEAGLNASNIETARRAKIARARK